MRGWQPAWDPHHMQGACCWHPPLRLQGESIFAAGGDCKALPEHQQISQGALAQCYPQAPQGRSQAHREPKTGMKIVKQNRKEKKKVKFGTFLISSLAPEPLGYIRFTFSSLFSVRRMTRNPHLADEGRAPRAFCGWGTWQDLWSSSPFDF